MKNKTILFVIAGIGLILIYGLLDPAAGHFPQCPFRLLTGWLCPGCGSQRAIHQLLHGHFIASFNHNQLFLPSLAYAGLGGFVRGVLPEKWMSIRKNFYGKTAAYTALAIIFSFSLLRNVL
ncbi:MAG: DUF2752 domain-containing protein [Bacteroidota bacterium]|nr:DUF2752 domain-containing protein [Bacteroidota bacterium]